MRKFSYHRNLLRKIGRLEGIRSIGDDHSQTSSEEAQALSRIVELEELRTENDVLQRKLAKAQSVLKTKTDRCNILMEHDAYTENEETNAQVFELER